MNRRDILAAAAAAAATGFGIRTAGAAGNVPVLGLILPPAKREVPEEGIAMYGSQLRFVVTGLGIERMTPDSFDAAQQRIPAAAKLLAEAGAQAIQLSGTSLTFYKGEAYNRELRARVTEASGL